MKSYFPSPGAVRCPWFRGHVCVLVIHFLVCCLASTLSKAHASGRFVGTLDLQKLNGTNGFVIEKDDIYTREVSGLGDFNADGVEDFVISAPYNSPNGVHQAGQLYVVFGRAGIGAAGSFNLTSLDGTNGFVINGVSNREAIGLRLSTAGDVNDDGVSDLAISSSPASRLGKSYIVYGGADIGKSGAFWLGALDGSNGFTIDGMDTGDSLGSGISSAGDVNNDGIDDLILGASGADPRGVNRAGESNVIFGRAGLGASGVFELSDLDGLNGFVLNGIDEGDLSGSRVNDLGDVNGDGIGDILIGAFGADPYGVSAAGESYVVFGKSGIGSSGAIDLDTLDGSNGFVLNGVSVNGYAGLRARGLGDVDGDGFHDFIIGSFKQSSGTFGPAESYVILGGPEVGASGSLDLASLDSSNGFVIESINTGVGSSMAFGEAGDINGDEINDITILFSPGGPAADPAEARAYVIYGTQDLGLIDSFDLASLDGSNGFAITNIEAGFEIALSLSNSIDINADGIDDLIINTGHGFAAYDNPNSFKAGNTYVVFGKLVPEPSQVIPLSWAILASCLTRVRRVRQVVA